MAFIHCHFCREGVTYGKLVAHDKHRIRLAADAHPVVLFHLLENDLLQASIVVGKVLSSKAPEQWAPVECQAAFLLELVVVEQHGVQTGHQQEVSTVHDVFFDDRVGPGFAQFFEVRVKKVASVAGVEPISPNLPAQHFVYDLAQESLEGTPHRGETMVVGDSSCIGHRGQLISVCVVPFLLGLESSKVMPLAIGLRDKVMEMPEMASLVGVKSGILGYFNWRTS